MKVLYISHASTLSGAPISFLGLMRYIQAHRDWEARIWVRMRGGPLDDYEVIAPASVYYEHCLPGTAAPESGPGFGELMQTLFEYGTKRCTRARLRQTVQCFFRPELTPQDRQKEYEARLIREIRAWRPDLIYSNTAVNGDVIRALDLPHVPVLVHVRELATSFDLLSPLQLEEFRARPVFYFAVSQAVRDYLASEQGIPPEKIALAPDAIEGDAILALAEAGDVNAGLCPHEEGDILIGGMGFLNARKGPDLFVEAARLILDAVPEARFVWLGEGPDLAELKERSRTLGIGDRVHFTGLIRNPYPYLKALDFILMTSRDDPFPRVNLEGALFRKPMICFVPSGGSREFAEDDCGMVVPDFDVTAMAARAIDLARDPALRARLGENAHRKVTTLYDVRAVAPVVIEGLERFAQDRPS